MLKPWIGFEMTMVGARNGQDGQGRQARSALGKWWKRVSLMSFWRGSRPGVANISGQATKY
jgi:hypothetical protein